MGEWSFSIKEKETLYKRQKEKNVLMAIYALKDHDLDYLKDNI